MTTKKIPIIFGQNLIEVRASIKKKKGYIKINLDDETINNLFRSYARVQIGKPAITKRMFLVIEEKEDESNKQEVKKWAKE